MWGSRSESNLTPTIHPSSTTNHIKQASQPRLSTPNGRLSTPSRGRMMNPTEEKQQLPNTPNIISGAIRLVDTNGRPFEQPEVERFTPQSHQLQHAASQPSFNASHNSPSLTSERRHSMKLDAHGLPILISPQGLKASDGDMSTILLGKMKKLSSANLNSLSTAKHQRIPSNQRGASPQQLQQSSSAAQLSHSRSGSSLQSEPAARTSSRLGHGRGPSTHSSSMSARVGGTARSGLDGEAASAWATGVPLTSNKLRVTDFSGDGGMGGRVLSSLSMEARMDSPETSQSGDSLPANSKYSKQLHHHPPHLQSLAMNVSEKSAMLRSQLRGLDLLSTAFGQLIDEIGTSKGHLAKLLGRVRDNYGLLFSNLIENILEINNDYNQSLKGCVNDYKNLQLKMDGKVAHLEHRVRILTSISTSKDNMIEFEHNNIRQLEDEIKELKDSVILGIKSAKLTVENKTHAILHERTAAQIYGNQLLTNQENENGNPAGGDESGEPNAFASGTSSVDALASLSHESRNLSFEISELIQNVELQQERSAAALSSLDTLLEHGVDHVPQLAHDAARRPPPPHQPPSFLSIPSSSSPNLPPHLTIPTSPQFRERSAIPNAYNVSMQVEHTPTLGTPISSPTHVVATSGGVLTPRTTTPGVSTPDQRGLSDASQPPSGSLTRKPSFTYANLSPKPTSSLSTNSVNREMHPRSMTPLRLGSGTPQPRTPQIVETE